MKTIRALIVIALGISSQARGEIPIPQDMPKVQATKQPAAKFSLQLPVLKYTTASVRTESAAGSTNDKTTDLSTQILDDGFIGISLGKLGLYIYPFDDRNHFVSAGYMITDSIELGVDVGLNQSNTGNDSTLFGVWGYHYMTLGLIGLENGLSISSSSSTVRNPPNPNIETKEFAIKVASTVTYPLARNLRYIGGAFIRNKSQEADGGAKTSTLQIGFILAGLRLKWI